MHHLRRSAGLAGGLFVGAFVAGSLASASEPASGPDVESILIWRAGAPDSDPAHWPRPDYHEEWERPGEILRNVTEPAIQVFLPDAKVNTGVAVVLCPGGGYRNLWIAKEGWRVARELQKRGIAGIVLKYRHYDVAAAVQDAQRAVRYVRSRAGEWRLKGDAVGIGGFSAGGHLALSMAAQLGRTEGWAPDDVDRVSKRPDFLMLIYPSVGLPEGVVVDASLPPAFFTVAADDALTKAADCMAFVSRLLELRVPAELHVYQNGGHGFGIGTPECRCSSWLDLFRDWLAARGLLVEAR
jgi:acetyl esterase/lipase